MPYSTNPKAQHVWNKARPVKGKNPNLYRRDSQGNVIYKPAYNRSSRMGWQVDHIWPRSKGGSDAGRNLQALQTSANKRKSNKIPGRSKTRFRKRRW
nr:HNH endonuclease domain-containing protein [Roseovarius sp. W115]MDV2927891.1 HNH endonuclease domain-containing protein [Roseovarius sp. W115]